MKNIWRVVAQYSELTQSNPDHLDGLISMTRENIVEVGKRIQKFEFLMLVFFSMSFVFLSSKHDGLSIFGIIVEDVGLVLLALPICCAYCYLKLIEFYALEYVYEKIFDCLNYIKFPALLDKNLGIGIERPVMPYYMHGFFRNSGPIFLYKILIFLTAFTHALMVLVFPPVFSIYYFLSIDDASEFFQQFQEVSIVGCGVLYLQALVVLVLVCFVPNVESSLEH